MTPDDIIRELDASLRETGEDVYLRRSVGTAPQVNVEVKIRAHVEAVNADDLVGEITQTASKLIFSPSEITRAQWPGGSRPDPVNVIHPTDPRLPRNGDTILVQGLGRAIQLVKPRWVAGVLVRLEVIVKGG